MNPGFDMGNYMRGKRAARSEQIANSLEKAAAEMRAYGERQRAEIVGVTDIVRGGPKPA